MFAAGQVVTVFRSRLNEGQDDIAEEYGGTAARMAELASGMPGYVEHKAFTADDGERVTLVTFADRLSHDGWREHAEHRDAQRRGREAFYSTYTVQVAEVTGVSCFPGAPY